MNLKGLRPIKWAHTPAGQQAMGGTARPGQQDASAADAKQPVSLQAPKPAIPTKPPKKRRLGDVEKGRGVRNNVTPEDPNESDGQMQSYGP